MIWRKHYRSMYEGSMIGAGAAVFALMGYVIAHQEYDRATGIWAVRLNPVLLSAILGESPKVIEGAIEYLCAEDKNSGSEAEGGRRLVALSGASMEYRVVNGEKYQEIRQYEDRKSQNRESQARYRKKKQGADAAANGNGDSAAGEYLPEEKEIAGRSSGPGAGVESASVLTIKHTKELERIEERMGVIKGQARSDAFGLHFDEKQKAEMTKLRARKEELTKALGFMV